MEIECIEGWSSTHGPLFFILFVDLLVNVPVFNCCEIDDTCLPKIQGIGFECMLCTSRVGSNFFS